MGVTPELRRRTMGQGRCGSWPAVVKLACLLAGSQLALPGTAQTSAGAHTIPTPGAQFASMCPGQPRHDMVWRAGPRRCYISPLNAAKGLAEGRVVIVDVRKREDFSRYRIRGSLNVPGYAIKTKRFLRPKPIVLVNEGRNHRELKRICNELTANGFTEVKILQGGLHAWRTQVGPLDGDRLGQRDLSIMEPRDLFAARDERRWLVVNVSPEPVAAIDGFSDMVAIPGSLGSERFVKHLLLAVSQRAATTGAASGVLIMDTAGEQFETFISRVDEGSLTGVFYLRGGASGYRAYLAMEESMWARVANPPARRSSCAPHDEEVRIPPGGRSPLSGHGLDRVAAIVPRNRPG